MGGMCWYTAFTLDETNQLQINAMCGIRMQRLFSVLESIEVAQLECH